MVGKDASNLSFFDGFYGTIDASSIHRLNSAIDIGMKPSESGSRSNQQIERGDSKRQAGQSLRAISNNSTGY